MVHLQCLSVCERLTSLLQFIIFILGLLIIKFGDHNPFMKERIEVSMLHALYLSLPSHVGADCGILRQFMSKYANHLWRYWL